MPQAQAFTRRESAAISPFIIFALGVRQRADYEVAGEPVCALS